ncbi:GntP family permease [Salmonella enterica subsp. enterica serovar Newport]|nr:GntP family permease [Salmonella enterica subsp. enterica serovar Newport]
MSENKKVTGKYSFSPGLKGIVILIAGLVIFYTGSHGSTDLKSTHVIGGLLIAIAALLFMILKTRISTFPALIIAAIITGSLGGMKSDLMIQSITRGFGGTLGNIGIVIGFGVMMGSLLQMSGASRKMALTFIRFLGEEREELALVLIGLIVSMAVFCDSAFIVLTPLVKSLSRSGGKSIVGLGATLAAGLVISHSMIPPAVGPFGVASQFDMSIGTFMLWSMVVAVPVTVCGFVYTVWLGKRIYIVPTADGEGFTRERQHPPEKDIQQDEHLPGALISFAPLVVPIILILLATFFRETGIAEVYAGQWQGTVSDMFITIGNPVVAVGCGLLIAIVALGSHFEREEVTHNMDNAIRSAGIILLLIGGGGALGMVLRDSGAANMIAGYIVKIGIPGVLLPLLLSTLIRLIQGSGAVAMITAASITAPMIDTLGVSPVIAGLGCTVGSFMFSYFNDAYFWVVNRSLGVTEVQEQIRVWSITSTILWASGSVTLLIINALFF